MAERNFSIRLSVIDGGKVKAELREVGESGEQSLKRIERAAQPASRGLHAINAAAGDLRGQLEGAASRLGPVGSALGRLGPAGLAAGAALAVVSVGLVSSVRLAGALYDEKERLEKRNKALEEGRRLTESHGCPYRKLIHGG